MLTKEEYQTPKWDTLADNDTLARAANALTANGIEAIIVENGNLAREKILQIIPRGSEVMTMISKTLEATGIANEINESGNFRSARKKMETLKKGVDQLERMRIANLPDYVLGSVHAITEQGSVLIASNSGSQMAAYVYGATHVIWVAGTQKIVRNTDEGIRRIYEHSYPLEDQRLRQSKGVGSFVSKLLIINKEIKLHRMTMILVKEKLGF